MGTIVALKILKNVCGHDRHLRHSIGGVIVIAANAGGTWSPVGDVTTTMLWIQGKISVPSTVTWLFLPSFVTDVHSTPEKNDDGKELPKVTWAKIVVLVLGFA